MKLDWFAARGRAQAPGARAPRFRKRLRASAPTVAASPLRRGIQAVCLALFLWLFFSVCWPYDARPAGPGATYPGWNLAEIDPETGDFRFAGPDSEFPAHNPSVTLYLVDQNLPVAEEGLIGAFRVIAADETSLLVRPVEPLTPDQFDWVLTGLGPWTFHDHAPGQWPRHYADGLASKAWIPPDLFLRLDPLVGLTAGFASREWVPPLAWAIGIMLACLLVPRAFCGYICPLGTTLDLFDKAVGRWTRRFRVQRRGWWVRVKYTLLGAVLVSAVFSVGLAGYVAPIPVLTRSMMVLGEPLQSGTLRGWHQVPPLQAAQIAAVILFAAILLAGVMQPRFWCRYVCPTGALFSLANLFRLTSRKVDARCRACGQCVEACPFDAIEPDHFSTRGLDCAFCQTCGGTCAFEAIHFSPRWERFEKTESASAACAATEGIDRRRFLSVAAAGACAVGGGIGLAGMTKMLGDGPTPCGPVRPPGSLPDESFLERCVRCGLCLKACPNHALQADVLGTGPERIWAPVLAADWAGCEPSCNACGRVCPTGAIRALDLEQKRAERMGLARVDEKACLPFAGRQECRLCVDECQVAGYHALEFRRVGTRLDADGFPIEESGFLAPVVLADRCVGCGLCQTRCYHEHVRRSGLLEVAAIRVGR